MTWRVLLDEPRSAAHNMAADAVLLQSVGEGICPPTLRLYRWSTVSLSIGKYQKVDEGLDMVQCRDRGIPVVRRPSGGRAILHGGDQTISIAVPATDLGQEGSSIVESYKALSRGLVAALAGLGVGLAHGDQPAAAGGGSDCFTVGARADLLTQDGRKLIGSAQCRRGGVILQQTSLQHQPCPVPPSVVYGSAGAQECLLIQHVPTPVLVEAILEGYRMSMGITLEPGEWTPREREMTEAALADFPDLARVDTHLSV